LNLCAGVLRVRRDTVAADIYYCVITKFCYTKCDLRLSAYEGQIKLRSKMTIEKTTRH